MSNMVIWLRHAFTRTLTKWSTLVPLIFGGSLSVAPCFLGALANAEQQRVDPPPLTTQQLFDNWKILETWDTVERSFKVKQEYLVKGEVIPISGTVKTKPDHRLTIRHYKETIGIFSRSPHYAFIIVRLSPKEEWIMKHFTEDPLGVEGREAEQKGRVSYPLSFASVSYHDLHQLFTLSQKPEFKVTRIISRPGHLDRVEFTYYGISGYLLTDRDNASLVMESRTRIPAYVKGGDAYVAEMKRELFPERGRDNVPRCKSIRYVRRIAKTGVIDASTTLDFSDYSDAPIPDEEFRLSHYGLPEPHGMQVKKSIPFYVWLLLGAAVFFVLAIVLRRRANRSSATG